MSPRGLIVFTASIASTARGANRSSSLWYQHASASANYPGQSKHEKLIHKQQNSPPDNLRAHARLRDINQRVPTERIDFHTKLLLQELARLAAREPVPSDNRRRVDLRLDELVRAPQELRRDDDYTRRAVPDFFVLFLREVDEDTAGGVLDFE